MRFRPRCGFSRKKIRTFQFSTSCPLMRNLRLCPLCRRGDQPEAVRTHASAILYLARGAPSQPMVLPPFGLSFLGDQKRAKTLWGSGTSSLNRHRDLVHARASHPHHRFRKPLRPHASSPSLHRDAVTALQPRRRTTNSPYGLTTARTEISFSKTGVPADQ